MNSSEPFKTVSDKFRKPTLQEVVCSNRYDSLYQTDDNDESDSSSDTDVLSNENTSSIDKNKNKNKKKNKKNQKNPKKPGKQINQPQSK